MASSCPDHTELLEHAFGSPAPERGRLIVAHLDECRGCRERLQRAVSSASRRTAPPETRTESLWSTAPIPPSDDSLPIVGHETYDVQREHARGGIGRILCAEDRRLLRPVALKELINDDPSTARRFVREALLTARLQHPSIVPVYEAGRWPDGRPFYAMKMVSGRPLTALISDATSLDRRLALLPHVIAVAEAIAYAHSRRVIHRDLKPSNVVVGEFGETMVVDWGLGKDLSASQDDASSSLHRNPLGGHTSEGAVMGTPSFMPPEQAQGRATDERADVYALGAILYTLLAGRPPYLGDDSRAVLQAVIAQSAPPVDRVQAGVPPDLVAIVEKAMAGEPSRRYADASELARDLRRFQSGQLVGAHHYSRFDLLLRWMARHRLPVTLSVLFVLLLATLGVVAVRRVLSALAVAERERQQAKTDRNEALLAGARALLDRNPTATLAWLKQYPDDGAGWDEARVLALEARAAGAARAVLWPNDRVSFFAMSPDGDRFALQAPGPVDRLDIRDASSGEIRQSLTAGWRTLQPWWTADGRFIVSEFSRRGELERFDLQTGAHQIWPIGDPRALVNVAVAPDGSRIALSRTDGTVTLLDADGKSRTLATLPAPAVDLELLDGGQVVVSVDGGGTLDSWNVEDGAHRRWPGSRHAEDFAVSPDQQHIVVFGDGIELWQRQDGRRLAPPTALRDVAAARFSPDGGLIALGAAAEGTVRLWSWRTGSVRELNGGEHGSLSLAFSRDGRRLASGSRDATIRVWDLATGESVVLRGHTSSVIDLRFGGDGSSLLSVSADQSVRLWTLPDTPLVSARVAHGEAHTMERVAGERALATDFESGQVTLADLGSGEVQRIGSHRGGAGGIVVAPDGQFAATGGNDLQVAIYDLSRRLEVRRLVRAGVELMPDSFSCDGRTLLAHESGGRALLVDVATGAERVLDEHGGGGGGFFSPDCRRVVTQDGRDFALHVYSADGQRLASWPGHGSALQGHAFSADSQWLLTGDRDGLVRLWRMDGSAARDVSRQSARIESMAGNGRLVAVGDRHGELGLYDFGSGSWRTRPAHASHIYGLDFSPDGKRLVSGGGDGLVRLWEPSSLAQLAVFSTGALVTSVRFSGDGKRLVATDTAGMLRVWGAHQWAPPSVEPAQLRSWVRAQTDVAVRPDRSLASP